MHRDIPESLRALADLQRGILTAGQLVTAGVSRNVIEHRVRRGQWQRLHTGTYAVFSGEVSREATLWAAVLSAGPGAALSHRTAAELDGLVDSASDVIHVTIPAGRRVVRRPGLRVHLSARAGLAQHPVLLPPRTRVEETVLDLAAVSTSFNQACGWVTTALGRRTTTRLKLSAALAARTRVRWRRELTESLADDMAGVHSVLEYRYVRGVEKRHRLPPGTSQERSRRDGRTRYRDRLYQPYRLVIELDGELAHTAQTRWDDIRRDNAAAADGLATLRYGWLDVTEYPCRVAAEVAEVLRLRGYVGCRPCGPGCPVGTASRTREGA